MVMTNLSLQVVVSNFLRHSISHDYNLNTYERFILRFLADYIGNNKEWMVSQVQLALDIATTRETINRNVKQLLQKQLVFTRTTSGKAPYYSLVIPLIRSISDPAPDPVILHHSNPTYTCDYTSQVVDNFDVPVIHNHRGVTNNHMGCDPQSQGCDPQSHIYNSNIQLNNKVINTNPSFHSVDNLRTAPERSLTSRESGSRHIQEIIKQNGLTNLIKKEKSHVRNK
jgi:hypothetical protein